ncbi:MAG: DciA family protein [Lentisphaeria bacterium]
MTRRNMPDSDDKLNYRSTSRINFGRPRPAKTRSREGLLREWYGEELADREVESQQPAARGIGGLIEALKDEMSSDEQVLMRTIVDQWNSIVDEATAKQAAPRRIEDNVLHVEVFNAAFRYHIQSFGVRQQMVEAVTRLSAGRISDVKLIVGGTTMRPGKS